MKFPFFKVLTVAGIVAIAWNCSSDPVVISDEAFNQGAEEIVTPEATNCWLIHGDVTYVIIPGNNGFAVTDTEGNVIGSFDVATATIIDNAQGVLANVTLSGRTLYKDGYWNTLCLPFNMTEDQVTAQLAPATEGMKTLTSTHYDESTNTLYLNFEDATTVQLTHCH